VSTHALGGLTAGGHAHLAALGADAAPPTLTGTCGTDPGMACRLAWDLTHHVGAAQFTETYLAGPVHAALRVIFVVALALVIRSVLHRLINRVTERATQTVLPPFRNPLRGGGGSSAPTAAAVAATESAMVAERRHQRVRALGSVLRSAASVTIFAIAGVVVLGDLGLNLAPLLASAGVVGIALGFGAQNLVRDYLSGVFMLLEDQYGVGDSITVGDATGTVETMTLRITRLRDVHGVVWHIRNGTIDQVGNQSQGWARAVVDFPVPYLADLAVIGAILDQVAEAAWDDPALRSIMLEKPEVWGAQAVSSIVVVMRVVARTAPLRQWEAERELRARIKAALDAAGIAPAAEPPEPDEPVPAPAPAPQGHRRPGDGS
jgi:small conductance mechanosensitive channel